MEPNKKFKLVSSKKTRYLLPNILTLGGVCLGISSIKFSIDGNFSLAVILILFAAILDALDGRVARLIKGTSEFGKELDSLTDFVSFGIAPVLILYFWELNNYGKLGWAIALIFSVCCVLRLARFNLTKNEENQSWKNNFFEGVPSPAGGLLILTPLIYELADLNFSFSGLKTAVFYEVKRLKTDKKFYKQTKYDISLAFQDAAIDCLVKKSIKAMRREDCNQLVLSGGVAANKTLREKFKAEIDEKNLFYPDLSRCTDNGAMIAFAASEKLNFENDHLIKVKPRWSLEDINNG